MRLIPTLVLTRMLLRFFARRVLHTGLLRSRPVRVVAGIGLAGLLLTCAASAFAFLSPVADDPRTWHLLFRVSTVSALLWVQIGFLLVKTLFLNADGLLRLSYHLPLTNRERAAAFMIYEAGMCAVVAGAGFFAVCVAAVVLLGPAAVPQIIEAVVLPVVLAYLALTALYLALARLAAAVRLQRIANVVLVLVLFAVLLAYTAHLPRLTTQATTSYLATAPGGADLTAATALPWISDHYGWGVMLALALGAAVALLALDVWLTPDEPASSSRFVHLRLGVLRRFVDPYTWFVLRSTQTWLAACVAWALFAYLAVSTRVNPLWALCVASMSGLYQFAATAVLRTPPCHRQAAWQIYAALVRSQCLLLGAFVVPAAVLAWLIGSADLAGIGQAAVGCLNGVVITVGIGILFPAEKDNPFSVFIGLALTFALLALVGVALGILHLPRPAVLAVLACAAALFAWYSVEGIRITEARRRHEEGRVGREQPRRSGHPHARAGRGNALVPHVHDA